MAQVPTSGNIEMFDSTDSIYEVVKSEIGTPVSYSFDAILSYVKAHCSIEQFDAAYRPATINDVNETEHFRGFPAAKVLVLGSEGNSTLEACSNAGTAFYTGGYTGTLTVGDTLPVSVNGNIGYFKILDAGDSHLIGDVVIVDDDNLITGFVDNPCPPTGPFYSQFVGALWKMSGPACSNGDMRNFTVTQAISKYLQSGCSPSTSYTLYFNNTFSGVGATLYDYYGNVTTRNGTYIVRDNTFYNPHLSITSDHVMQVSTSGIVTLFSPISSYM